MALENEILSKWFKLEATILLVFPLREAFSPFKNANYFINKRIFYDVVAM